MRGSSIPRLFSALVARTKLAVGRGVLRLIDDAKKGPQVQLSALKKETLSRVELFQHFGFSSSPPLGTELVFVCVGGNRDHAIVVGELNREARPTGHAAGEVELYNANGVSVLLRADGAVVVVASGGLQASDDVQAGGDVVAGGDVADAVGTLDALRQAYNVHVHPDPQGGSTGPPVPTVP